MYRLHRIFCATQWEMEAERSAFYEIIGEFNEKEAMSHVVLFVPVALTNVRDKRPFQYDVEENIRACRHYILLVSQDWGPPERNFENDYHLALQCVADPSLPMRSVAVLRKRPYSGRPLTDDMPKPRAEFSGAAEFAECLNSLLSEWLASLLAQENAAAAGAS